MSCCGLLILAVPGCSRLKGSVWASFVRVSPRFVVDIAPSSDLAGSVLLVADGEAAGLVEVGPLTADDVADTFGHREGVAVGAGVEERTNPDPRSPVKRRRVRHHRVQRAGPSRYPGQRGSPAVPVRRERRTRDAGISTRSVVTRK